MSMLFHLMKIAMCKKKLFHYLQDHLMKQQRLKGFLVLLFQILNMLRHRCQQDRHKHKHIVYLSKKYYKLRLKNTRQYFL